MCGICSFSFSICPFTQSYVMLDTGSYPRGFIGSNPSYSVRDASF